MVIFQVGCLTILSVSRLYRVDDRMNNECGADGLRMGKGMEVLGEYPPPMLLSPPQIPDDLELNQARCDRKQATNSQRHGMT
jgi:hypothetical protein